METLLLEGDNPASELLRYLSETGTRRLVLGSRSLNCITRYDIVIVELSIKKIRFWFMAWLKLLIHINQSASFKSLLGVNTCNIS